MAYKFFGKRDQLSPELQQRLPPGQNLARRWPVLTQGDTPEIAPQDWQLRLFGEVESPVVFTWDDLMAMPQPEVEADFHCVTHWTKIDNVWNGVLFREILPRITLSSAARYVLVHCYGNYTTNLPLSALDDDDVLLAHGHNGEPLTIKHGFPMRLVVPKRYGWKSAKWINGFEFLAEDKPGYWEQRNYHNDGHPWQEERWAG